MNPVRHITGFLSNNCYITKMSNGVKKIAITGGKGGTGKSTLAVLLAGDFFKKGKKVVLIDCDVECPNDYLLIGEKLLVRRSPNGEGGRKPAKKVYANFPQLDRNKCKKCGLCAKTCRQNAIFQPVRRSPKGEGGKPDYPIFIKDLCSACGACWIVCPHKAIKPRKEEVGKIFINKIKNNFWLITGLAKPCLEETGPVVNEVKKFALDFAEKKRVDIVLFDTAAGTHCPVITAILDCDLAYAVTEPTPMGAYDLRLILDLCKKLKVPAKVILNQADLGDKAKIYPIAKKFKVRVEKEIPYSRKLVEAYSKGRLLEFNL